MIILNYIYLCIYKVFKITSNKYVFDSPESYAIGFLSIMYFSSFIIFENIYLNDTLFYDNRWRGFIGVVFLILIFVSQFIYYLKNDRYKKIEKKLGGSFLIGLLIMIFWVIAVYWYINYKWIIKQ